MKATCLHHVPQQLLNRIRAGEEEVMAQILKEMRAQMGIRGFQHIQPSQTPVSVPFALSPDQQDLELRYDAYVVSTANYSRLVECAKAILSAVPIGVQEDVRPLLLEMVNLVDGTQQQPQSTDHESTAPVSPS